MLAKRIIPCLDVRAGRVTKGIRFQDNRDVGDPVALASYYSQSGADELVFYDIGATPEGKGTLIDWVSRVAAAINIPFSVGGGIRSLTDMYAVLAAGAEKISLNTAAVKTPELITAGAREFGSQCVVVGIDVRKLKAESLKLKASSGYEVVINGGRVGTGRDAVLWAEEVVSRGAGEICLNSIDADGTRGGYDLAVTELISQAVSVPVIASGGAGKVSDVVDVFTKTSAQAALLASILHFGEVTIAEVKEASREAGVTVRL